MSEDKKVYRLLFKNDVDKSYEDIVSSSDEFVNVMLATTPVLLFPNEEVCESFESQQYGSTIKKGGFINFESLYEFKEWVRNNVFLKNEMLDEDESIINSSPTYYLIYFNTKRFTECYDNKKRWNFRVAAYSTENKRDEVYDYLTHLKELWGGTNENFQILNDMNFDKE